MSKLINELRARFIKAKQDAEKLNIDDKDFGQQVFIYPKNESRINPKYISSYEYNQIEQFYQFLINHQELSVGEVDNIVMENNELFFLRRLKQEIPNFYEYLTRHGAQSVAIIYVNNKLNKMREVKK